MEEIVHTIGHMISKLLFSMKSLQKRKKHSYLILELLIGLFLLGLFLSSFLQTPLTHMKKQLASLSSFYLDQVAKRQLIFLEEKLRTGQISFTELASSEHQKKMVYSEKIFFSPIDPTKKCYYESKLFLSKATFTKKPDGTVFGTVQLSVEFYPISPKKPPCCHKASKVVFVSKKQLAIPLKQTQHAPNT
jgi:hypothetical protein